MKFLYEEKARLEQIVEQMRNELNIKEIYIRQLTNYSENDPAKDQNTIQSLNGSFKLLFIININLNIF